MEMKQNLKSMEQLQTQMEQNKWYRFPIKVVDKKLSEALDGDVPEEQMEMSWYDIHIDSIKGIRPYYGDDFEITGTLLHLTTGDNIGVELKPSTVRKLIGYEPTVLSSDFPSE